MNEPLIRTVLVDDEPLAIEGLELLLKDAVDFEIVGRYRDGESAIAGITQTVPDIVFLDVQMPHQDGLQVVAAISKTVLPHIVFVTAHHEHAIAAFEHNALDYLLKPIDCSRFAVCLERIRQRHATDQAIAEHTKLRALVADHDTAHPHLQMVSVKSGARERALDIDEVDWIESRGNYTAFHTVRGEWLCRAKISTVHAQLEPNRFLRIHRSTVVRIEAITELRRKSEGSWVAVLRCDKELSISRSRRNALRTALGCN